MFLYRWPIASLPSSCMLCTPPRTALRTFTPRRDQFVICGQYVIYLDQRFSRCGTGTTWGTTDASQMYHISSFNTTTWQSVSPHNANLFIWQNSELKIQVISIETINFLKLIGHKWWSTFHSETGLNWRFSIIVFVFYGWIKCNKSMLKYIIYFWLWMYSMGECIDEHFLTPTLNYLVENLFFICWDFTRSWMSSLRDMKNMVYTFS
jgi:hypothetical protein